MSRERKDEIGDRVDTLFARTSTRGFVGGPLSGKTTQARGTYLDSKGNPVSPESRSTTGDYYIRQGSNFVWYESP